MRAVDNQGRPQDAQYTITVADPNAAPVVEETITVNVGEELGLEAALLAGLDPEPADCDAQCRQDRAALALQAALAG